MWICPGPQTQLNTLLVSFSGMMTKRDVELRLHFRIRCAMAFGEAEERPVARVVRESFGERVPLGEIDSEVLESLEQIGLVRIEQSSEINAFGIGAPREQEVCEIERSRLERLVQNRTPIDWLEPKDVAIAQEQEDEIPMLGANGRAKRAFERSPFRDLVVERLYRSSLLNPTFGLVHTAVRAEMHELAQLVTMRRGLAGHARRWRGIRTRVNEFDHRTEVVSVMRLDGGL